MRNLFVVDVDGVLTTGKKTYSESGMPSFKEFYDKDFTAMKEFQACDYDVIWISGDDFVNKKVAENRNYPFYSARNSDKGEILRGYIAESSVQYNRIIAVGDDLFDLPLAALVDCFYLPKNANWRMRALADNDATYHLLNTEGGAGVIEEISSIELSEEVLSNVMDKIIELDRKESF